MNVSVALCMSVYLSVCPSASASGVFSIDPCGLQCPWVILKDCFCYRKSQMGPGRNTKNNEYII